MSSTLMIALPGKKEAPTKTKNAKNAGSIQKTWKQVEASFKG
jgi:hypothetical protein